MAAGRAGDGQGPGEAGEGGVSRQLAGAGAPAPAISSAVIKAGAAPPSLPPLSGPHQTLITAAGFYGERFGPLPASSASLTLRKHGADIPAGSGLGHCLETARARPPTSISRADPPIGQTLHFAARHRHQHRHCPLASGSPSRSAAGRGCPCLPLAQLSIISTVLGSPWRSEPW